MNDDSLAPGLGLLTSDLDDFRDSLARSNLPKALALHQRGFAARLDARTVGEEYEDWLLSKRESLRRRLRDAAVRDWDRCRPTGAWREAREAAEVLGALEPDSESAVMKLVEARAMNGDLQAAEAAARDYLTGPGAGLKLSPGSRELLARIRNMTPVAATITSTVPPPPPIVGRSEHLATARRMLRCVAQGSFEFLLAKGEGGVGKTRFLEEVRKEAGLAGFRCLIAHPTELERRIPLNPLVDMLSDPSVARHIRALEEPWRAVIASLLPTLPEGMEPPVLPPIADTSLSRRLYDAFATLLTAIAASEPVMLFIDDLQWVDATTVTVLQFVQRRWRAGPLGIVAAVRADQVAVGDGLGGYMTGSSELQVTSVELGDLSEPDARALVDLVAGQAIEASVASRLLALAGRSPFYLIELTRDYLAGEVQLPELPTEAVTLPISLLQLLEPRVKGLGRGAANVSAYLAVFGRSITLAELAGLTRQSEEAAAVEVEALERCRLATVEKGRVRLAHELFRSAIYQSLSATRRSLLHGEVGAFLDHIEGQQPGEIAIHFDRAGNAAAAAQKARQAADRALESGAMAEAAYLLQLVVENVSDAALKAEATADLGHALHMNREISRANPVLELAAARLRAVGDHARALRMDIRRVEGLAELGAAPLSELLDRLATTKSLARVAKDDEALALALDAELHLLHRSGKVDEIRTLFDEVRAVTSSSDPAAACLANGALALNVLFGDAVEALRSAREAVRLSEAAVQYQLRSEGRLFLALFLQGRAKTPEARETLAHARRLAHTSGDLLVRCHLENNAGLAHLDACELDEAGRCFEASGAILRGADASIARLNYHCNLGELALLQGDIAQALDRFTVAEGLFTPSTTPQDARAMTNAAIGLCSLEIGALGEARRREALMQPLPTTWHFDPTIVLTFAVRLLETRGRHPDALSLLRRHNHNLRHTLPMSWMKLLPTEARLARKLGQAGWRQPLLEAAEAAQALGLTLRAKTLLDASLP